MRTQVTAYLYADTNDWLDRYSAKTGLNRSEVVRLLLEREKQVKWLQWALQAPDPGKGIAPSMKRRQDKLPIRWDKPPR